MSQRYFVEPPIGEGPAELQGDEARHLTQVMRARVGQSVTLFDGSGAEFEARIEHIDRARVGLTILARRDVDRESPTALTLGVALPKGDRQRWMVEKAVELGVHRLVPLRTERGVAQPVPRALERLRRTVVAASKQSGRNRLMTIDSPREALDHFTAAESAQPDLRPQDSAPPDFPARRWIAHPGGQSLGEVLAQLPGGRAPLEMAVGPEGGWTDAELRAARDAGWGIVDLGPRILRVETAALVLAALVAIRDPNR